MPDPVRTAHTAITGRLDSSIVCRGPRSMKLAPAARLRLARCITYSCETSE